MDILVFFHIILLPFFIAAFRNEKPTKFLTAIENWLARRKKLTRDHVIRVCTDVSMSKWNEEKMRARRLIPTLMKQVKRRWSLLAREMFIRTSALRRALRGNRCHGMPNRTSNAWIFNIYCCHFDLSVSVNSSCLLSKLTAFPCRVDLRQFKT